MSAFLMIKFLVVPHHNPIDRYLDYPFIICISHFPRRMPWWLIEWLASEIGVCDGIITIIVVAVILFTENFFIEIREIDLLG